MLSLSLTKPHVVCSGFTVSLGCEFQNRHFFTQSAKADIAVACHSALTLLMRLAERHGAVQIWCRADMVPYS